MKILLALFGMALIMSSNRSLADGLNRCADLEWTNEDSRTQAGGWNWYPGKGKAQSLEDAYTFAEGLALKRLLQECQLIPANVKFNERCDFTNGSTFAVFVRASVLEKDCAQTRKDSKNLSLSNQALNKQYEAYLKKISSLEITAAAVDSKPLDKFELNWNKGDEAGANNVLQKECKAGTPEACFEYAYLEHLKGNIKEAKVLYTSLCSKDNLFACVNLGKIFHDKKDFKKAIELYEKGCHGGVQEACFKLGRHYRDVKNEEASRAFFQRSCDNDYFISCTFLGESFSRSGNIHKAKELFNKACDGKEYYGCWLLARELKDSDLNARKKLFNIACDGGIADACMWLGAIEERQGNKQGAIDLGTRQCDRGTALSCVHLSFISAQDKNYTTSIEFLDRALSLGFKRMDTIKKGSAFEPVRKLPAYKALLAKYKIK